MLRERCLKFMVDWGVVLAYFTAGDGFDAQSVRNNSTTLSGPETVVFDPAKPGSYWFRISNPQAGQVIAGLPDVSIIDFPGGTELVQDMLAWKGLSLYQAYQLPNGSVSLVQNAYGSATQDSVLASLYPKAQLNDYWERLTVAPGQSSKAYLNEFYLEVSADSSPVPAVFGNLGTTIPNVGRALITPGTITGARDAAWGNWRDVIKVGDSTSTAPAPAPDLSSQAGTPTQVISPNGTSYAYNGVTVDETTGTFTTTVNGVQVSDTLLNTQYQIAVNSGMSKSDAVMHVLESLAGSTVVTSALTVLQGTGNPYPAAWGSAASQILTSVSLKSAIQNYWGSLGGILTDELNAFDHGGPPVDLDKRIGDASARFVFDAGTALSGPLGNAVSWITHAIGLRLGNSKPEIDAFLKHGNDQAMLTLSPGHKDKYVGTSFNDMVTVNPNSIAFGGEGDDVLAGSGSGGDILDGGPGNDTLIPSGSANYLIGGGGTDTVVYHGASSSYRFANSSSPQRLLRVDPAGNDVLVGISKVTFADGTATLNADGTASLNADGTMKVRPVQNPGPHDVMLTGRHDQYVIAKTSDGQAEIMDTVAGRDGTQVVPGVQHLLFANGTGIFDPTGNVESVTRLYQAAFNRAPDVPGIDYSTALINAGSISLAKVADGFITSDEFIRAYGNPDTRTFVTSLYQNVLHRAVNPSDPLDVQGVQNFSNLADSQGRGAALLAMSDSQENHRRTLPISGDRIDAETTRLYQAAFNRAPDAAGFDFMQNALRSGVPADTLAEGFVASGEFQRAYGSLSSRDFVAQLYRNVLHREADQGGLDQYTRALDANYSRGFVLASIADSTENRILTAGATHDAWVFIPA